MVEHPLEMGLDHRSVERRQDVVQRTADKLSGSALEQVGRRWIDRPHPPPRIDQDDRIAQRFEQRGLRGEERVAAFACGGAEPAVIGERNQHMRILSVMRDDDRLARRLQPPIAEAADKFGSGHALRPSGWLHTRLPKRQDQPIL